VSPGFKRHPNVERLWERFGMKDRLVYVNPKDTVYAEEVRASCRGGAVCRVSCAVSCVVCRVLRLS
jgi:hypothetical protein